MSEPTEEAMMGSDYKIVVSGINRMADYKQQWHSFGEAQQQNGYTLTIEGPWGDESGRAEKDAAAELTRIVTAVNAHDDLVAALAGLVNYSSGCVVSPACGDCAHCRARAALAKAKGGSQ